MFREALAVLRNSRGTDRELIGNSLSAECCALHGGSHPHLHKLD
jgi:hypothetical protein